MDIAFGDGIAVGRYRYALIFVDRSTIYNWVFGLKYLQSANIVAAFSLFCSETGALAHSFCSDCDDKLFGSAVKQYLLPRNSDIIATAADRQSSNGLVEPHWKTMVHIFLVYPTEKQMAKHF